MKNARGTAARRARPKAKRLYNVRMKSRYRKVKPKASISRDAKLLNAKPPSSERFSGWRVTSI